MNLDFFNDLVTKVKESDLIQNFITELSTYLANSKGKDNSEILNMNSIEKEYCLNSTSSKSLKQKRDEILESEARNLKDGESLYYTAYKNTFKDTYQILEFNNTGKSNSFYLSENELPNGISVDKVLLKVNGEFKIDNTLTKNIMNEIENYAKEISKAQNERLDQYRKENTLYQVVDRSSNGVYLQNKDSNVIFEETNISKELMNKISNDSILRYKNGEYIYEEELTKEFFNNL